MNPKLKYYGFSLLTAAAVTFVTLPAPSRIPNLIGHRAS